LKLTQCDCISQHILMLMLRLLMCSLVTNVKCYVYVFLQVNIDSYLTSQENKQQSQNNDNQTQRTSPEDVSDVDTESQNKDEETHKTSLQDVSDVDTESENKNEETERTLAEQLTDVDARLTSNYSYFSSFALNVIILSFSIILVCLQCFDDVGWMPRRASGL